ncbi:MAG: hypothetical protein R2724_18890 [Bryobacterales bacterium]
MEARILILATVLCAGSRPRRTAQDFVARGNDHYFNLEHDEALADYYRAMRANGPSASLWNHIATALLYKELTRLGKLETSAFRGDNSFLDENKPEPDPEANKKFLGALYEAPAGEADGKKPRRPVCAVFALCPTTRCRPTTNS